MHGNTNHAADRCRYKDAKCFGCGKVGHITRVCRSKQRWPAPAVNEQVVQEEFVEPPTTPEYPLHAVTGQMRTTPITTEVNIDEKEVCMEVDTVSVVSEATYKRLWPEEDAQTSSCEAQELFRFTTDSPGTNAGES